MDKNCLINNIEKCNFPDFLKTVLSRLENAGHSAYVVGGAVRDIILGRDVHDWDITTSALPNQIKSVFSDFTCFEMGIKHGTVTVKIDKELIEITTFRKDGDYIDSRHPENVSFTLNLEEDLVRRDFTVNAMALSLDKVLIDPYNGLLDIKSKTIRAVGDPIKRFTEDALRIMRAFRFAAKLGFTIERKTLEAASMTASRLDFISRERINEEWHKLLEADECADALLLMKKSGVLDVVFKKYNIDECSIVKASELDCDYTLRFAALFRNCPLNSLSDALERINPSNKEIFEINAVITAYNSLKDFTEQYVRRYCYFNAKAALYGAKIAICFDVISKDFYNAVEDTLADSTMIFSRKELKINGNDILSSFDLEPRRLGEITDKLMLLVIDKRIENSKVALLDAIAGLI